MITFARLFIRGLILAFALAPFAAGCDDDSVDALEAIAIDDTIRLNGLSAPVRVYRTELNVPIFFASNPLDRYRVMGFIMAKDRYAQIDLGRRVGQGRIGELVGSFGEEIDRQTRNRGLAERCAPPMGFDVRVTPSRIRGIRLLESTTISPKLRRGT